MSREDVSRMKIRKVLLVALCALMLVAAFSTAALADDQDIAIQLDGQNIQVGEVAPIIVDGRTFVPFRVLFEAMGATVDYDDASRTVKAERDGLNISFVIGEKSVTIAEGENTTTEQIDAASFIRDGRTLVPVRFAAQALGASVGWDAENRTVLIIDTDKLLAKYQESFTLMDLLLADNAKYYSKPYAFKGDMAMSMELSAGEDMTFPIEADIDFDGLTEGVSAMEMNMTMNLAMEQVLNQLIADTEEVDAAAQAELDALVDGLKNLEIHLLMDMENGKYYMQSAFFNQMLSQKEETWLSYDFAEILANVDTGFDMSLLQTLSAVDSMDALLNVLITVATPTDINSYAELVKTLDTVETVIGDKAFVQTGNTYTAKTSVKDLEGMDIDMTLEIKTANKAFSSYALNAKISAEGMALSIDCDLTAAGKQDFTMTMDIASLLSMEVAGNIQYTATQETVPAMPSENVVDAMDLLLSPEIIPEETATDAAAEVETAAE